MTRTTNTHRVTFSANVDGGEGYLTAKNEGALQEILEFGGLWALDVIGDWEAQIGLIKETAEAQFMGFMASRDEGLNDLGPKEMARKIWFDGVIPCGKVCDYYSWAGLEREDYEDVERYSNSAEFIEDVWPRVVQDAQELALGLIEGGPSFPHGRHPTYAQMLEYAVLVELTQRAGNVARIATPAPDVGRKDDSVVRVSSDIWFGSPEAEKYQKDAPRRRPAGMLDYARAEQNQSLPDWVSQSEDPFYKAVSEACRLHRAGFRDVRIFPNEDGYCAHGLTLEQAQEIERDAAECDELQKPYELTYNVQRDGVWEVEILADGDALEEVLAAASFACDRKAKAS